jgi:hypothetical protein
MFVYDRGMSDHLDLDHLRSALAAARVQELPRICEAVRRDRVVGVFGEAEVGKTHLVEQALARCSMPVLRMDLRFAAGEGHLGFELAREMASALAPDLELLRLARGGELTAELDEARQRLMETLGIGLQEAVRRWPSGRYGWNDALASLLRLAQSQPVVLWVDHLEAPRLTFRHPLRVEALLGSLGEVIERTAGLRLLLSGRPAAAEAREPRIAFERHVRWLKLRAPRGRVWRTVAESLKLDGARAQELAELTCGHPRTMMLALESIAGDRAAVDAEELLHGLAARDDGLALRSMEHARSLHRLGGQVLIQAALGQKPYASAQRGAASTQDLSKALTRLRLAGLIRNEGPWGLVNPLLAMRLRAATALSESPTSERPPWS